MATKKKQKSRQIESRWVRVRLVRSRDLLEKKGARFGNGMSAGMSKVIKLKASEKSRLELLLTSEQIGWLGSGGVVQIELAEGTTVHLVPPKKSKLRNKQSLSTDASHELQAPTESVELPVTSDSNTPNEVPSLEHPEWDEFTEKLTAIFHQAKVSALSADFPGDESR